MNYTRGIIWILTAAMTLAPLQILKGETVQTVEETPVTGTVVTCDTAVGGISLLINNYYDILG